MLLLLMVGLGAKAQDNPLTFEAIEAGTVSFEKAGDFNPDNNGLQYRTGDGDGWTEWTSYTFDTPITLEAGQKLQFRSTSTAPYSIDENRYCRFTCTANCYLYGSVGPMFNDALSLQLNACSRMFYGNTHIRNRSDKSLVLPATTLAHACYEEMFSGCTALTTAPELPATSLANYCYNKMRFC